MVLMDSVFAALENLEELVALDIRIVGLAECLIVPKLQVDRPHRSLPRAGIPVLHLQRRSSKFRANSRGASHSGQGTALQKYYQCSAFRRGSQCHRAVGSTRVLAAKTGCCCGPAAWFITKHPLQSGSVAWATQSQAGRVEDTATHITLLQALCIGIDVITADEREYETVYRTNFGATARGSKAAQIQASGSPQRFQEASAERPSVQTCKALKGAQLAS